MIFYDCLNLFIWYPFSFSNAMSRRTRRHENKRRVDAILSSIDAEVAQTERSESHQEESLYVDSNSDTSSGMFSYMS